MVRLGLEIDRKSYTSLTSNRGFSGVEGGGNLERCGRTIGTMKFSLSFRNSISDGDKSSECGCYRGTFPMGNNFH